MTYDEIIELICCVLIFYFGMVWERKKEKNLIAELKACYQMMDVHWEWINDFSNQIEWAFDHLSKKNQKLFSKQFQEKRDDTTRNI